MLFKFTTLSSYHVLKWTKNDSIKRSSQDALSLKKCLHSFQSTSFFIRVLQINFVIMIMVIKVVITSVTSMHNSGNNSQVRCVHSMWACVVLATLRGWLRFSKEVRIWKETDLNLVRYLASSSVLLMLNFSSSLKKRKLKARTHSNISELKRMKFLSHGRQNEMSCFAS